MNVHVYDTHVYTIAGEYIHFDVLVDDHNKDKVQQFAETYLNSLGVSVDRIKQGHCNFCHSESANPEVQLQIEQHGYSIIRL
ncbi:DUF2024 family protein [Thalassotalea marina]|uniref:DUF2024 family protein n=1 Tax=Thalassotalea marina TaxID=1673741 RepID=A0A919EJX9_9GAMM|nr:DUF2024 family protein [Thalassotalea marina]GHF89686.1 hypothetical protein GCM10017161_16960 [Thalassotalea marina]